MYADQRGLDLTTDVEAAARGFDATLDQFLEFRLGAGQQLKETLAADPDFGMAHCLRGYLFMLFGTNATAEAVRESLQAAEARKGSLTRREQAHIAALGAWSAGDVARACDIWDEILVEHPTDLLALKLQHQNIFWMGRNYAMRSAVARVLDAWDENLPGYGNVLGMYAFALEECGDYAAAEPNGRRAVELSPEDLWAVHAVTHVLEMQGRAREGSAWLDYPADAWDDRNPFKGHLWWHLTLFDLAQGEIDKVLARFDDAVYAEKNNFYSQIFNASSLLYRLEFLGVDVGDRWRELADQCETRLDDHVMVFTDIHVMMALAADGRHDAAGKMLASLRDYAKRPDDFAAGTMAPVTIPVCEAILAFAEGEYEKTVELLLPIRAELPCIGGSHAQRDLFAQFLIEAAVKCGRLPLARALLSERTNLRPHDRYGWAKYAGVLDGLGDAIAAEAARGIEAQLAAG